MARDYIGVIRGEGAGNPIFAVIDPADDAELDNPNWLTMGVQPAQALRLIKLPRSAYEALTNFDQLAPLVSTHA